MTDDLDRPIGNKEQSKLSAGAVIVQSITIDEKPTKKGGKVKILTFHCKHPEREELVKLSNIKLKIVQGNNETIKKDALWYNLDDDGNIAKNCNVAIMLRFYKKETLKQFEGQFLNTELDASGFLCIKAY